MRKAARLYPVFLKLEGKLAVVVGAGMVALRKAESLLECGARVKIVGPDACGAIRSLASAGRVDLRVRRFRKNDLGGAVLAFAATDDAAVNAAVAARARDLGIPVNSADDPDNCDFYVPSTVSRGGMVAAVSTGGLCPALAVKARKIIEAAISPGFGILLRDLAALRENLKRKYPRDPGMRKRILESIAESDALDLLDAGDLDSYRKTLEKWKSSS